MHRKQIDLSAGIETPEKSASAEYIPLVVKIGGSLFDHIPAIVPIIKSSAGPLLIVPGGGPFADRIRDLSLDDESSHWMAIAGMEQYGWYLGSFGLPCTDVLAAPPIPTILLPYRILRERDPLPHSWDITSDTISAWVAHQLKAELLVLKSVDGITREGILQPRICSPVQTEIVDPGFISFVLERRIRSTIINGLHPDRVKGFLDRKNVLGTIFDVTF